ncbi:MAG TPA: outer membrane beta-barrel protein, partial [Woeseiaceae bacterium]|nr:outer membrane beta-barrel protein [Woeseiaceae bacterium]
VLAAGAAHSQAYFGYRFTPNWSLEAGFNRPERDFSLVGKVGALRNSAKLGRICAGNLCVRGSDAYHRDVLFGAGAQYRFADDWAARLDYERYGRFTGNDVVGTRNSGPLEADAWRLSVNYGF